MPRLRFSPGEESPVSTVQEAEGPRVGLDTEVRGKHFRLCRESNLNRPVRSQTHETMHVGKKAKQPHNTPMEAKGKRHSSYSFTTSALDGVVSVTPRPRFTPGTHWTGDMHRG
jgi:hypothetical protein